jgi:uncharacterized protein (DUF302 family)
MNEDQVYIVSSEKPVAVAAADLESAVKSHGFGVLHVHDLQKTMQNKGVDFPHPCRILEVCNPQQALRVLSARMEMNMLLPCRLSVWEEEGRTRIGMVRPTALLGMFRGDGSMAGVAEEVERATIAMIDDAR